MLTVINFANSISLWICLAALQTVLSREFLKVAGNCTSMHNFSNDEAVKCIF